MPRPYLASATYSCCRCKVSTYAGLLTPAPAGCRLLLLLGACEPICSAHPGARSPLRQPARQPPPPAGLLLRLLPYARSVSAPIATCGSCLLPLLGCAINCSWHRLSLVTIPGVSFVNFVDWRCRPEYAGVATHLSYTAALTRQPARCGIVVMGLLPPFLDL